MERERTVVSRGSQRERRPAGDDPRKRNEGDRGWCADREYASTRRRVQGNPSTSGVAGVVARFRTTWQANAGRGRGAGRGGRRLEGGGRDARSRRGLAAARAAWTAASG